MRVALLLFWNHFFRTVRWTVISICTYHFIRAGLSRCCVHRIYPVHMILFSPPFCNVIRCRLIYSLLFGKKKEHSFTVREPIKLFIFYSFCHAFSLFNMQRPKYSWVKSLAKMWIYCKKIQAGKTIYKTFYTQTEHDTHQLYSTHTPLLQIIRRLQKRRYFKTNKKRRAKRGPFTCTLHIYTHTQNECGRKLSETRFANRHI